MKCSSFSPLPLPFLLFSPPLSVILSVASHHLFSSLFLSLLPSLLSSSLLFILLSCCLLLFSQCFPLPSVLSLLSILSPRLSLSLSLSIYIYLSSHSLSLKLGPLSLCLVQFSAFLFLSFVFSFCLSDSSSAGATVMWLSRTGSTSRKVRHPLPQLESAPGMRLHLSASFLQRANTIGDKRITYLTFFQMN